MKGKLLDKKVVQNSCLILFFSCCSFSITINFLLFAENNNKFTTMLLGTPSRLEWETLLTGFAAVIGAFIIYSKQEAQSQYHINNNWKTKGEELYGKLAFAEFFLNQARDSYQASQFKNWAPQLIGWKHQLQPLVELNAETLAHFEIGLHYVQIKLRSQAMIDLIESCVGNNVKFDETHQNHAVFLAGFEALADIMAGDLSATKQKMQKKLSKHQQLVKKFEK